jgi:uncharacterized membrane protein YsdA (DUF1294 family)
VEFLIAYLLIINIIAFWSMRCDKRKAVTHSRRTPEKRLFLYALLGGSPGSMVGMAAYRHKTRHLTFTLGMPLIFLAEAALCFLGARYFG